MKKFLAILLAAALCLSLVACGGNNSSSSSQADSKAETSASSSEASQASASDSKDDPGAGSSSGTTGYLKESLTVANSADGGSFDPFGGFINWGMTSLTSNIFEHLIVNDFDYNVYNQIAKEITQEDDTHWKVTIWDNIRDTDGTQMTIDDVIWSFDQFVSTGNKGGVPKFESWEKIDDYSATMVLSEPFGDGDYIKHFGNPPVLIQSTYESHDMVTDPVGTGPYKLSDYTVNSRVVLEANEDYWGNEVGLDNPFCAQNFRTITYDIIQDASSRAVAIEMGNADTSDSMDIADVEYLVSSGKATAIDMPQRAPVSIIFNASEDSVMGNVSLRKAVLYALDNAAIASALSVPATECFALQPLMVDVPESWRTGEGRDYYSFDADKAAELMSDAGYNGETIRVAYVSSTANDGAAIMMQSQLNKAGFNVELNQMDQTVMETSKYDTKAWDIRFDTMGGGAWLSQTVKGFWSEDVKDHIDGGRNAALIADPELDDLYVALKNDDSEANINAWEEYFNDKAYAYSICTYSDQTVCAPELKSVILNNRGNIVPNAFELAD